MDLVGVTQLFIHVYMYMYPVSLAILALFDAHCDSAPLAPAHLIQLNHKKPYQVCTVY